jgi:hypothetical protein
MQLNINLTNWEQDASILSSGSGPKNLEDSVSAWIGFFTKELELLLGLGKWNNTKDATANSTNTAG